MINSSRQNTDASGIREKDMQGNEESTQKAFKCMKVWG